MRRSDPRLMLVLLFALGSGELAACSDDSGGSIEDGGGNVEPDAAGNLQELGIKPFQPSDEITLVEGQSYYVTVRLNLPVTATTYVDIINEHEQFIRAVPPTLQFVYGDQEHPVSFNALEPTGGEFKVVRLTIRGTDVERPFKISVTPEVVPDSGMTP